MFDIEARNLSEGLHIDLKLWSVFIFISLKTIYLIIDYGTPVHLSDVIVVCQIYLTLTNSRVRHPQQASIQSQLRLQHCTPRRLSENHPIIQHAEIHPGPFGSDISRSFWSAGPFLDDF